MVWRLVAPVFNPLAAFLTTGGLPPQYFLPGTPLSAAITGAPLA